MTSDRLEGLKVADRIFWGALSVSVVANAVGGWVTPSELHPFVNAVGHGVIPLLAAATKYLLVKTASTGSKWADGFSYLVGGVVAAATVWLSVYNLAHLGELLGFEGPLKWAVAVAVDGLMLAATIKSVALAVAIVHDLLATRAAKAVEPIPVTSHPAVKAKKPASKKSTAVKANRPASKPASKARLDVAAVADVLAVESGVTAQVLAERFGVSKRTIQRTSAWQNRNNEQNKNEEVANKIEIEEVAV